MSEANIHLTDPDALLSLFGPQDQYLKIIRNHFGVAITHRDGKLKIIGEESAVRHATGLIETLHKRAQQSGGLTLHEVQSALGKVAIAGRIPNDDTAAERDLPASTVSSDTRFRLAGVGESGDGLDAGQSADVMDEGEASDLGFSNETGRAGSNLGDAGKVNSGGNNGSKNNMSGKGRTLGAKDVAVNLPHQRRSITPRSDGQIEFLAGIRSADVTLCRGPAGCGKTYLAVAVAVEALKARKIRKIVLVRPAVEAGESLGFLPGDLQAKLNPYLRPLLDALNEMLDYDQVKYLMEHDVIEVIPLAYMRGRTLNEAFIILDEAQNTTSAQMKMFLTRMGEGSKIVVSGDVTQVDLPGGVTSGLRDAWQRLQGLRGVNFVTMKSEDIVRHRLVQDIVNRYDSGRMVSGGMNEQKEREHDSRQ